MKKEILCMAALLAALASIPQLARATPQDDSNQSDSARQMPTPEDAVAKLDKQLSLTDDQKAKITPIIAERQEKMKALKDQSGHQKWHEMKSIMQDSDTKIEAVLTDTQKQKYEEMRKEMREHRKERRQEKENGDTQPQQ